MAKNQITRTLNYFLSTWLLIGLCLSSCTPVANFRVTSYHSVVPVTLKGFTYAITPEDQKQIGSLEFQAFANILAGHLNQLGLKPEMDSSKVPDLLVMMSYSRQFPHTQLRTYIETVPVRTYGEGYVFKGGMGLSSYQQGWWDIYEDRQRLAVEVLYPKLLKISIFNPKRESIFEGYVETEDFGNQLVKALPYMLQALFAFYPSTNGVCVNYSLPLASQQTLLQGVR